MKKLIGIQDPLFTWALHPNHLYQYGLEIELTPEELLLGTGLTLECLEDIDLHISWAQYRDLALNVQKKVGLGWGLQFGSRLSIGSHGLVSLLALNCTYWHQILELLTDYPVLVSPIFYTSTKKTDNHTYLNVRPEFTRHPVLNCSLEAFFAIIYKSINDLGGEALTHGNEDWTVYFRSEPPPHKDKLIEFFNGKVEWGYYADQVKFPSSFLPRKIANGNPVAAESTRRIMKSQLNMLPATHGGLNELRKLFEKGIYKQEECAAEMFTTLATLKRFLKNASTSFSNELTLYRIEEACWAARYTDKSAAQLADELGFQDVNSLGRLFKKEVGMPFSSYCERHRTV